MSIEIMQLVSKDAETMLKTLANSNRLMILCHLIKGPMTVSDIVNALALSQSAVSQHLVKLKQNKIVSSEAKGKNVWYQIDSPEVTALMAVIQLIYCRDEEEIL
jgi:ArsR family transcriptional regulator